MKKNALLTTWRLGRGAVAIMLLAALLAGCAPAPTPAPTAVPPTAAPVTGEPPTAAPTVAAPTAAPVPSVAPATADDPTYVPAVAPAVIPPGVPGQPMITAAYNTMIRGGPGTQYTVYGAFLGSATAIAVGVSADYLWYVISVPVAPGGTGWVDAAYALPSGTDGLPVIAAPPVPPTVDVIPPGPEDPQAVAVADTYVRTGPAETYPAYGIVHPGTAARVIGKSADALWLVVRITPEIVGLGYGWVNAAYVTTSNIDETVVVIDAPEGAPPVAPAPPPSGAATAVALDYVNLREGPGTNYRILGTAAPGASGEIVGKSQDGLWWQVKVPTTSIPAGVAWVDGNWVSATNTANVPVVTAPAPPASEIPTTPPPGMQCSLVSQNPADYSTFGLSEGFGVSWVLQNTGTVAWEASDVDLVFQGAMAGMRLHQNGDVYDITQTVTPGQNYAVNGSLITPATPGQYGEAWALQRGGEVLCTFWIIINVQ
jgi:uncharacterized protein YgiM (DUF1202 family)